MIRSRRDALLGAAFVAALVLTTGATWHAIERARADAFGDGGAMVNVRVQGANVVTDASGNWSVPFKTPFVSSEPIVHAFPINGATNPGVCNVATRTASSASGKCWLAAGVTVSVLGSVVNVFSAAGNIPVMVNGREPTQ